MHHVVQNLIDHVLLKDPKIAIGLKVLLQRFQFEAQTIRHISNKDRAEIGEAGFGADRGELGVVDEDLVSGKLVGPGFNLGEIVIESGCGMIRSIAWRFCHSGIVPSSLRAAKKAEIAGTHESWKHLITYDFSRFFGPGGTGLGGTFEG